VRVRHRQDVEALAARALQMGAERVSMTRIAWRISGDCEEPYWLVYYGRPEANNGRYFDYSPGRTTPLSVEIGTRCRSCKACVAARRSQWEIRARKETARAARTWFGTLTVAPKYRAMLELRAANYAHSRGSDPAVHPLSFAQIEGEVSKEITKFLKRLRKSTKAKFKYLLVAEAHKDGWPHHHILISEQKGSLPIKKRVFQSQWVLGFTSLKLAKDANTAHYVCKYISKGQRARVRASLAYGNLHP
jgi:hypothetical protein